MKEKGEEMNSDERATGNGSLTGLSFIHHSSIVIHHFFGTSAYRSTICDLRPDGWVDAGNRKTL
jgi:hypothetical protein